MRVCDINDKNTSMCVYVTIIKIIPIRVYLTNFLIKSRLFVCLLFSLSFFLHAIPSISRLYYYYIVIITNSSIITIINVFVIKNLTLLLLPLLLVFLFLLLLILLYLFGIVSFSQCCCS